MKFLHLADLHLGKVLLEQSLIEDQEYILNQILKKITEWKIDGILISGDIYDKPIPSLEAINLLDNFLNELVKKKNKKVFMISGNHDSKDRLGFGNRIFEEEGLFICSKFDGKIKKVELEDAFGKINIYLLPFVKPYDVKQFWEEEISSYDDMMQKIIEHEDIDITQRNVILTHQFVTFNGKEPERTDSETITIGGLDNVDVSNFKDFDYVAIGHVHRPQKIGRDTARYSGTPLKYSFSEMNHHKSVPIIDMKEKENVEICLEELVPLRDMREIRGPIEELVKKENYEGTNLEDYIRAIVTNEEQIYDALRTASKNLS